MQAVRKEFIICWVSPLIVIWSRSLGEAIAMFFSAPPPLKECFSGRVAVSPGIWGDGSAGKINPKTGNFEKNPNYTWKDFAPLLKKQGYDTIISVDYSAENANSFDDPEIMEKVRIAILEAIDTIRSNNLAGRKVDIVAHSMGGLVVRSFCEKEKEFCKESIRKLITIDTPHQGSELADLLLIYRDQRDKFPLASTCRIRLDKFIKGDDDLSIDPHPIDKGAVDAMAVGNPQVGILESADPLPVGKWNVLPWPASPTTVRRIAGNATNYQDADILAVWDKALSPCGFDRTRVFSGEGGDDGIVGVLSQMGGVSGRVFDEDHFSVLGDEEVAKEIGKMLNEEKAK